MKKHLKKIVFAVCLMVLTLTLASCGATPKLNLEKAADNLERRDYYVSYTDEFDEDDYEEMMMVESLYAYDGDEEVQMIKFKDAGTAKLYIKALKIRRQAEIDEIKLEMKAYKLEIRVLVHTMVRYAFKLESQDFEDIFEDIQDLQDDIKDCREEIREIKKEVSFGRMGKVVWYGTEEAVKDTK